MPSARPAERRQVMVERFSSAIPEVPDSGDPALFVTTAAGLTIPSAEYYDEALAGWMSDDPYVQLTDLEDAMARRGGYGAGARRLVSDEPAREVELFIRRPVMPTTELSSVLEVLAPLHKLHDGVRCHKPGLDRDNGLHATLLNTRGLKGIDLPDEELFEPARSVPALGQALGKLAVAGVEIFAGNPNYHVVLLFGQKVVSKLRKERDQLEARHFPSLSLLPGADKRVFSPHVTVLSASRREVAERALSQIRQRARLPRNIDLAPARHTYYRTLYAEPPLQTA